jgi:penicillin-binding protein 1B
MSNRVKAKKETPKIYKSLRYRLRMDDAKNPPKKGFFRRFFGRIFRLVFNPITISLVFLLLLGVGLAFAYFWNEYSEKVDSLLRGDVFTQNAGVYSAPKILKDGEAISRDELVEYLKSAGYIEKNSQADENRSRYQIEENSVKIEPGATGIIDDKKIFPAIQVKFGKQGKGVASISDLDAKKEINQAKLEPKVLSSITAERDGRRKTVAFSDIPENLKKAILVTEDRAFFEHYGVNFRGIARALWRRYEGNDNSPVARQGGSSITQQLVKNLLLNDEQTLERKSKEALMSVILETRLSKEEIFTLYVNQIYLGQQAGVAIYGVGEAANAYFGKDVTALNLPEAAMIAGIIRSPNRYNPYKNPDKTTERRNQVLESMLESGTISPKEFDEGKAAKLQLTQISAKNDLIGMPYFSQYVVEQLPKVIPDADALQHLRVYTTIDPDLQKAAYYAVVNRLEKLDRYFPKKQKGTLQAALIAIRPKNGEIVAMVGGRNYLENQFNRATDAMRQPGSVFKPFVYAAAINSAYDTGRVFTTATTFKDEKKTFTFNNESYSPNNYGDVFSNQDTTLRDSLVKSKNTITVDLAMQLNIGKVMNLAHKAGFPKVERAFPSMALGTAEATPLQVATGYSVFANLGDKTSPIAINRVTTGEGKTVTAPVAEKKNVLKPDVAFILNDIMKDIINRGTATDAQAWGFKNVSGKLGYAGKTGTSRDGWFAGFTPELVCVVYVGFDENDELGMKGGDSALPIWADFMRQALNLHPEWNGDWTMPDSIRRAEIDSRDGKVLRELNPQEAESIDAQQKLLKKNKEATPEPSATPDIINSFLSKIPLEFRRVELFVSGTIPRDLSPQIEEIDTESIETKVPEATPTPFTTWEDAQSGAKNKIPANTNSNTAPEEVIRSTTVMVCGVSGMRATINCPKKDAKTFKNNTEPKELCPFHNAK